MPGNLHRRHRIDEAGRQPAEPAVAQSGIRLRLDAVPAGQCLSVFAASIASGRSKALVTLLANDLPSRNSIDR